jgi:hypothetical protein
MAAEAQQVVIRELLAAKTQDKVLAPGLLDRGESLGSDRPGQINPFDVGRERRPGRSHPDALLLNDCRHRPKLLLARLAS